MKIIKKNFYIKKYITNRPISAIFKLANIGNKLLYADEISAKVLKIKPKINLR